MPELPFIDETFGIFSPQQLRIVWYDEPRPPHEALDVMVAESWKEARRDAERKGVMLFNGQLARHLRHRVEGGILTIDVGPTDYATFMGTNWLNHARGDEFGWELYSNPLGTTATLISSDGWLVYGRRNHRVACHPGYIHTFGGGLEADEKQVAGTFDGFESVLRELDEELALKPSDVTDMVCLGLIRDPQIRQPELIFDCHVKQSLVEIESRLRPDDPDEEHDAVVACRDAPDAVVPFIRTAELIAPVAIGAICQHGRRHFGSVWHEATCRQLANS